MSKLACASDPDGPLTSVRFGGQPTTVGIQLTNSTNVAIVVSPAKSVSDRGGITPDFSTVLLI